jgi:hypothetical protein
MVRKLHLKWPWYTGSNRTCIRKVTAISLLIDSIALRCTDDGSEEPDIGLCELVAYEVVVALQDFLQAIKGVKQGVNSGLICCLC